MRERSIKEHEMQEVADRARLIISEGPPRSRAHLQSRLAPTNLIAFTPTASSSSPPSFTSFSPAGPHRRDAIMASRKDVQDIMGLAAGSGSSAPPKRAKVQAQPRPRVCKWLLPEFWFGRLISIQRASIVRSWPFTEIDRRPSPSSRSRRRIRED